MSRLWFFCRWTVWRNWLIHPRILLTLIRLRHPYNDRSLNKHTTVDFVVCLLLLYSLSFFDDTTLKQISNAPIFTVWLIDHVKLWNFTTIYLNKASLKLFLKFWNSKSFGDIMTSYVILTLRPYASHRCSKMYINWL